MTEFDKLVNRLKEMGAVSFHAFPGELESSVEERAAAINAAMDAIERGDFEIVNDEEF